MAHDRTRRTVAAASAAVLLSLALLGSPPRGAEAGEPVRVKGTSVRVEPPEGFVVAERFPGFLHEETQSSIQVTVVPGPRSEVSKAMTRETLASRGMTLVAITKETVNGREALVAHVEQSAYGVAFDKWLVLAGDETATIMLVGTTPKSADEKLRAAVRAALLGAKWDPGAPTDPYEGLPFRLTPVGTLTHVRRMGGGLGLTEPGRATTGASGDPLYLAAVSLNPVDVPDVAALSRIHAAQTTGLKDVSIVGGLEVKVAGLDAYEIVADATDAKSAAPLRLYQVIVLDGKGYWILVGMVDAERWEEWLPLFRKITASIRKQEAGSAAPTAADEKPASK